MILTATPPSIRAQRIQLRKSRRIASTASALITPTHGRWNAPTVTDITDSIKTTPQSLAIARQIIAEFSERPAVKRVGLMQCPNRAHVANVIEGYYLNKVVEDYFLSHSAGAEELLTAKGKTDWWKQKASEFYYENAGR